MSQQQEEEDESSEEEQGDQKSSEQVSSIPNSWRDRYLIEYVFDLAGCSSCIICTAFI